MQLRDARDRLQRALSACHELAAGGTAVGTGLNAPGDFAAAIAAKLGELTGLPLTTVPNKFAAQGSLDAMVMVCLQVIGEDSIVASVGAQGNFELNAMRPIIINNVLHSAGILGDASDKLRRYSIEHTTLNRDTIEQYVQRSLMLVTALSPYIGYGKASAIAHKADDEGTALRDAALSMGVSAADFDRIVNPKTMVGHPRRDLGIE